MGDVKENQEYIFNHVKSGDTVTLKEEDGKYYIFHEDKKIGMMNIENLYSKTMYHANRWERTKKKVEAYQNVRVKDVITVAKFPDYIEEEYASPYKDTGLWIAIELEGFGRLKFRKEQTNE